jgi:hypothetical protein
VELFGMSPGGSAVSGLDGDGSCRKVCDQRSSVV